MFQNYFLSALIVAESLLFWTFTPNFYATPKEVLYSLATLVISYLAIYHLLVKKTLRLPTATTVIPLLLFILSISLSIFFNPEGRPEALGSKASILLTLPLFSLFFTYTATSITKRFLVNSVVVVGSILSLHSLVSLLFLYRLSMLPLYMQSQTFTPTGSYLTTLFLIVSSIVLIISQLKHPTARPTLKIGLLMLHVVALVAVIAQMLPGNPLSPQLLSYTSSWSIALDALKSMRSLLFGIGISNYSLLYTSVRPLTINASELFNLLPQSATSELLTLLPTAGILATMSLLYIMLKTFILSRNNILFTPVILTIISFFIIPSSLIQYLLLFIFYGILTTDQQSLTSHLKNHSNLLVAAVILVLNGLYLYPTGSNYLSEYYINRAQRAISANESQVAYDSHLRALTVSPKISNYYISFADISFRLALALSQKPNLSDEDRQNISKLIQQSIESCKNAISLRPNDSRSWVALAKIYQNLLNVAQGADNFALEAYTKAVSLDRANPELRVELGNLFNHLATLPQNASSSATLRARALNEISTSLQLKNDFAAAYYSLAKIYIQTGESAKAQTAFDLALKYLDPESPEYARVQSEKIQPNPSPSPTPIPQDSVEIPSN